MYIKQKIYPIRVKMNIYSLNNKNGVVIGNVIDRVLRFRQFLKISYTTTGGNIATSKLIFINLISEA